MSPIPTGKLRAGCGALLIFAETLAHPIIAIYHLVQTDPLHVASKYSINITPCAAKWRDVSRTTDPHAINHSPHALRNFHAIEQH
jgi:hypothetical protein